MWPQLKLAHYDRFMIICLSLVTAPIAHCPPRFPYFNRSPILLVSYIIYQYISVPLCVSRTQLKILQPLPNTPTTVESSVMDPTATTESGTRDVMPIPTTPTTEESVTTPTTVESVMDPHATTESATRDVMPIPTTPTTESVMDPPDTSDLVMVCLLRFITTLWS